jgi:steroid 5-alpha reductase family enzyme
MLINLLYLLISSLLLQYLLFIPAFLFKTDKLTDLSYSLSFVLLSLLAICFTQLSIVKLILFLMILFWALRLGGFLLYRVLKLGKDVRFDNIRNSFSKFFVFWTLQGISVFYNSS